MSSCILHLHLDICIVKTSLSQLFCYVTNQELSISGSAPLRRFNFVFAFHVAAKQGAGRPAGQTVPLGRRPDGDQQAAEGDSGQSAGGAALESGAGGEGPAGSREVQMLKSVCCSDTIKKKKKRVFKLLRVHIRLLEDQHVRWLEDKHELQERKAQLQQKYSRAKEQLQRAAAAQKKVGHVLRGCAPATRLCLWKCAFVFFTKQHVHTVHLVVVCSHSSCGRGQRCLCSHSKFRHTALFPIWSILLFTFSLHKWWVVLLLLILILAECDD